MNSLMETILHVVDPMRLPFTLQSLLFLTFVPFREVFLITDWKLS